SQCDSFLAGPRGEHVEAVEFEHVFDQLEIERVVLDDEDARTHQAFRSTFWLGSTRARRKASSNSSRPTGLVRYSTAPAARPRVFSSRIDMTITGSAWVCGSA